MPSRATFFLSAENTEGSGRGLTSRAVAFVLCRFNPRSRIGSDVGFAAKTARGDGEIPRRTKAQPASRLNLKGDRLVDYAAPASRNVNAALAICRSKQQTVLVSARLRQVMTQPPQSVSISCAVLGSVTVSQRQRAGDTAQHSTIGSRQ